MYTAFYGLREKPFALSPDPRFLYLATPHREALAHLLYGIEQGEGFISITGEVGTGKTTLCHALLGELEDDCHTALILNPVLTTTQLILAVCDEFGVQHTEADLRLGYLRLLNGFLLQAAQAGKQAVLIIDEAQDMTVKALEAIRLLTNSVSESSQAAIQIAAASNQQLVGMEQIAKAMEDIKQASEQNLAGTKQLEQSAKNLDDLGKKLQDIVRLYRV